MLLPNLVRRDAQTSSSDSGAWSRLCLHSVLFDGMCLKGQVAVRRRGKRKASLNRYQKSASGLSRHSGRREREKPGISSTGSRNGRGRRAHSSN